ncbi:PREDICTED: WD repeat-containing protein 66 isoform X2 [Crocodylus porosus]|uniref:WD repeat-containing protein 66 isoform X2 n=1 Tax=Crocodylus porosus TaxID=8502 RepID=UPI00093B6FA0|nr:PREDICTED: WD repeat-containing protein 66 isoform X2 [Crocodylus porosus]
MDDDSGETPLKGSARGGTEDGADPPGALQEEEASREAESPKQVTETSLEGTQGDPGPMDMAQADSAAPEAPPEESKLRTMISHDAVADVLETPSNEREEATEILEDADQGEQLPPAETQPESVAPTVLLSPVGREQVCDSAELPSVGRAEEPAETRGTSEGTGPDEEQTPAEPPPGSERLTPPRPTSSEQEMQQLGQEGQESHQKGLGGQDQGSSAEQKSRSSEGGAVLGQEEAGASAVSSATPGLLFEEQKHEKTHPLSLSWVFGYNSKLPVYSLLDEENRVILYVSAHTAVIHDVVRNRQYHLQGHSNSISCLCVSVDKRWIVTADQGPDNLVIVWDAFSGIPVHTIFGHPGDGVSAIAISHDAKYLATISAGKIQRACIWKWTSPEEKPQCSIELEPRFGYQNYITFNPKDHGEFVSNSKTQVIFYLWDSDGLRYSAPLLTDRTFNKVVGLFSQSIFHFKNLQALTGTSGGKLVVWDAVCPPSGPANLSVKPYNMKAIKLMHLQKDALTVLTVSDSYFVMCDVKGHIKFYDGQLQLVNWYSHFNLGPIYSISFSKSPPDPGSCRSNYSSSCTIGGQPFIVRNFILSTLAATVLHVTPEGTKLEKLVEEAKEAVNAISCHPTQPLLAIGSHCGLLKVWDYQQTQYLTSRIFTGASIQCLSYDPEGSSLAAGFTDGSLRILDSISLDDDCKAFKYSRGSLTHLCFSHDSQYLATADEKFSVTIYKVTLRNGRKSWEHLAGLHAHYKPIRSVMFGVQLDSNEPRLLSLGEDRLLVEYDLGSSSKDQLAILRRDRIEQCAIPLSLAWYPPFTTESFILTTNDQYKMKLYNATTKMCRKTLLGPTYGSPLEKIQILPVTESQDPQKRYLAYIAKDKVGLQILPMDGNPHKSSAFICHPGGVSNLASSYDGCYVFTAGGNDRTVMKWEINLNALEAAVSLGGEDLIPFYNLLDGGRDGEFFRELEDYFYYAQLRSQGIDTMETRQVSTHIPLEEVPFVMRAMGYYPSEEKIEDIINEVKFSEYVATGKQVTKINLGDFIKLYINHRPAFGLSVKEIQSAFQVLGYENENGEKVIKRGDLLQLLQCRGEHMTEEELAECLSTLLGMNPEGGTSELGTCDPAGAAGLIEEEIPEEITAERFTADILGLPIPEPEKNKLEKTDERISSERSGKV